MQLFALNRNLHFLNVTFLAFISSFSATSFAVTKSVVAELKSEKIQVLVSIEPEAYFVSRIGGNRVDVSVLIKKGQSPASYSPTSKEMSLISNAAIYFRIGVPFEAAWVPKIKEINTAIDVLDLREKLPKDIGADPHVWNSPALALKMAGVVYQKLKDIDPKGSTDYQRGFLALTQELTSLDHEIRSNLSKLKKKKFLVFHPAWAHFAKQYGLEEIAIERHGKEPGPKELSQLVLNAKKDKIDVIYVQQQFDRRHAGVIAKEIGATIVSVDPLARDYISNLRSFSLLLRKNLSENK